MKRSICVISFLLLTSNIFAQTPLPNWIDLDKESIKKTTLPKINGETPPQDFRIPAEYEPIQSVVMGAAGYYNIAQQISKFSQEHAGADVWMTGNNKETNNLFEDIACPIDSVWMRDYGPFGLLSFSNEIAAIDAIYRHYQYRVRDDQIPTCLGKKKNFKVYQMPLIMDGGNLMVDSSGNLFMTNRTYYWNKNLPKEKVDQILKDYLKVKTIHVLEYAGYPSNPVDGTGHIDMFVKLLSDDTVLITKTDSKQFIDATNKAREYFSNILAPNGEKYKIIEIPGVYQYGTWYSYTNSLIANNLVMMPIYKGKDEFNKKAKEAYRLGLPNHVIKEIYSDDSITSGGSIHCLTQTIPKI